MDFTHSPRASRLIGEVDTFMREAVRGFYVGAEIVHPLTDEPWGVRASSSASPTNVIKVMASGALLKDTREAA